MIERTLVFVDTSYLLASFYNSWETGARGQLEIDLREVVNVLDRMITQQLNQPVQRQLWYDGIPESGPHRYQRSLRTIDGVQLRAGQLIEWGDRRTQKAVDTRLVADMVIAGIRGQVSDMVLVSGDADMLPGVAEAAANGVRVHLYGFGWDSMSGALRHACDSTTILDPREDFADAMQLNVLQGPIPPVVRGRPFGECDLEQPEGATAVPDTRITPPTSDDASEHPTDASADVSAAHSPIEDANIVCEKNDNAAATPTAKADSPRLHEVEHLAKMGKKELPVQAEARAEAARKPAVESEEVAPEASTRTSSVPGPANMPGATPAAPAAQPSESATKSPGDTEPPAPGNAAENGAATANAKATAAAGAAESSAAAPSEPAKPSPRPNPSMMAPRRKLRSRYVPLPNEVWTSAGFQTPFDVGQQYATWWYEQIATDQARDTAHLLSGGGLPAEIDRPLLQFACETLHEYTLTETQRVNLRDGFHAGIRGVLLARKNSAESEGE